MYAVILNRCAVLKSKSLVKFRLTECFLVLYRFLALNLIELCTVYNYCLVLFLVAFLSNVKHHVAISDDSISGFQLRYDIDMILTKYSDIDAISIFCKCVKKVRTSICIARLVYAHL